MVRQGTIALLVTALFAGCAREQWDDCITSTGPERTDERVTGDYDRIVLEDRIDLVLEDRPTGSVTVTGGRNLLGQVVTEVHDGELTIRNDNRCNWVRSFKPRITVHASWSGLHRLRLLGTGDVSCTGTITRPDFGIDQDGGMGRTELRLDVDSCHLGSRSGAGDLIIHGAARAGSIFQSGTGHVDAYGIAIDHLWAKNDGLVHLRCRAPGSLHAIVEGSGDIRYAGSPTTVTTEINGSGRVIAVP